MIVGGCGNKSGHFKSYIFQVASDLMTCSHRSWLLFLSLGQIENDTYATLLGANKGKSGDGHAMRTTINQRALTLFAVDHFYAAISSSPS